MKIKKKSKPASEAQKRARERNWNKGQILCIRTIARNIIKSETTPFDERIALRDMEYKLNEILQNWSK